VSEVLAAIFGFLGGAVGGLLGVGGGVIFVPALAVFLDHGQLTAESTSLFAIVPVAVAGVMRQRQYGNVRLADGVAIGLLSIPGVAAGVLIANAVSQRTLELSFAALLVVVAFQLILRGLRSDE
jgi:uncharacterized protein